MIWYEAKFGEIKPFEVVKVSDKQVTTPDGRRHAKDSDWVWYRPTVEEARAAMVKQYEQEFEQASRRLENARERLEKAHNAVCA